MLALRTLDEFLDISPDIAIALKFSSPLFNDVGDYSYPFKLPLTNPNKRILNFIHRVENSNDKYQYFPTDVLWCGIEIFSGTLRIRTAGSFFEGVLYLDKGNFNWQIANLMLHELDLGHELYDSETAAMAFYNETCSKCFPEVNIAFPMIENDMFTGVVMSDEFQAFYNYYYTHSPTGLRDVGETRHLSILVPFLYLRFVLSKIVELTGYVFDDQFFTKTNELSNLVLYNSWNIDEAQLFGGLYPGSIFYQHHVPHVKVNLFIHELEKYFNCRFFVNDLLKTVTVKGANDILFSSPVIPFSECVTEMAILIGDRITGLTLTMKGDDNDQAFTDQTKWEQDNVIEWTGSVETMEQLLYGPISNIIMIGDVWYVIDSNIFYRATIGAGGKVAWVILTQSIDVSTTFNYKYLTDTTLKIDTAFSCLCQTGFLGAGSPFCENLKADWKKISPRLIFVTFVDDVIKAHSRNDNMDLNFNGPVGIFNLFYKAWVNWMMESRTNVQFNKQLSFLDIRNLDFSSKYEVNGNKYLLSEIAVTLTKDTIKPAVIKAFSCL